MKKYNYDEKLKLYYIDYTSELGTERIYASKEENMQETINAYRSMLQDIRNGKKLKKLMRCLYNGEWHSCKIKLKVRFNNG